MKNNHNILRGIMTTITTVCVCIVLSLCALTGYAAETGGDPPPQPSGETETTSFPLPIRENPVAAGYHDFYVIREDGTLIKSTTNYDKGSRNGFTFNYTVEVMDNAAAVYVGCDAIDDVLVVDQDGTLWVNRPAYYGIELMPGEETDGTNWFKLEEDVAMAAVGRSHTIILKRDGSLWLVGYTKETAPWIGSDAFYTKVMDDVIWVDSSYYGAYAITASHELWGWGFSKGEAGPVKLAEDVIQVSSTDMALTSRGELLSWTCTKSGNFWDSESACIYTRTEPTVILEDVARCGKGYIIKADGTLWTGGASWGVAKDRLVERWPNQYGPYDLVWGTVGDGTGLQKIAVENAAFAATGAWGMVILDKNGTLWGVYDLNITWNGPFRPFYPVRLMDGCYGAEEPAGDGMDHFAAVRKYQPGMFPDVKENDWFYENVKAAYELGLMNGYTDGTFQPNGAITVAEAIAIAARVRAVYRGDPTEWPASGLWYQPYVDYCLTTQIQNIYLTDYSAPANRHMLAILLSGTLPVDRFPAINPGITFSDEDESYVKWMAEAGIVQGRGGGLFDPDAPVTRCEATAMLSRCAYPGLRLHLEG